MMDAPDATVEHTEEIKQITEQLRDQLTKEYMTLPKPNQEWLANNTVAYMRQTQNGKKILFVKEPA
jgi:hypothetical protein